MSRTVVKFILPQARAKLGSVKSIADSKVSSLFRTGVGSKHVSYFPMSMSTLAPAIKLRHKKVPTSGTPRRTFLLVNFHLLDSGGLGRD